MKAARRFLFRVLDANLNRTREGLRVCEEVARLVLEDLRLTKRCQRLRYDVERTAQRLAGLGLIQSRDVRRDVGRPLERGPVRPHRGMFALAQANLKRVQEGLRVLEEFSRLDSPKGSKRWSVLRFRSYALEQAFHSRLSALRHR